MKTSQVQFTNESRTQFANALSAVREKFPHWPHAKQFNLAVADNRALYLSSCHEAAAQRAGERVRQGLHQFTNDTAIEPDAPSTTVTKAERENVWGLHGITDDEFDRVWSANKHQVRPIDYNRIFSRLVSYFMGENDCSRLAAVQMFQSRFPDFFAKVTGVSEAESEGVEAAEPGQSSPSEVANSGAPPHARVFNIPGCTPEQYTAAWKANGEKYAPQNFSAIFAALVRLEMKSPKVTYRVAAARIAAAFPNLAAQLQGSTIDTSGIQK